MFNTKEIFSYTLHLITVEWIKVTPYYRGIKKTRFDKSFAVKIPCNPTLKFFGLSRFSKNQKRFPSRLDYTVENEKQFNLKCKMFERYDGNTVFQEDLDEGVLDGYENTNKSN